MQIQVNFLVKTLIKNVNKHKFDINKVFRIRTGGFPKRNG